jgi:MFS transporter, DHA1 family, tetracycline resistance protein
MTATTDTKRQLMTLFAVVFLELLAYCLVMPSFYPIFLDLNSGLLSAGFTLFHRKVLYGLLMMCYPLAQITGAPIMGTVSDKIGRKKVLSITLLCNILGYTLAACALSLHRIELIFIGFIISGITGGNIPVSQSAIADISSKQSKAKNMSLVLASYGFCYVIGSQLGGNLAYVSSNLFSPYALPYWCAASISALNFVFVTAYFKETFLTQNTSNFKSSIYLKDIVEQFKKPHNLKLITIIFLSFFGWNFFIKIMQVFLNDRYDFLAKQNANTLAYLGFWTIITQAFLIPKLSDYFTSSQFLKVSTLVLGLSLIAMPFTPDISAFYLVFTFAAVSYSFILPNVTAIISNVNTSDAQGKIMGISQSIQSLAKTLSPLPAAFLSAYNTSYPLFASGAALLLTWVLFTFVFRIKRIQLLTS